MIGLRLVIGVFIYKLWDMKREANRYFIKAAIMNKRIATISENPTEVKRDALEVIRLCQLVLLHDAKNGDAHIMLANAYVVLALGTRSSTLIPHCIARAFMIIRLWHTEKSMRTINPELGLRLYDFIHNSLETLRTDVPNFEQTFVNNISLEFLFRAAMPRHFSEFKSLVMTSESDLSIIPSINQ